MQFDGLRSARGAHALHTVWLDLPFGENVHDLARSDEIIKDWLVRMLLDGGYTGVESRVEPLTPPQVS